MTRRSSTLVNKEKRRRARAEAKRLAREARLERRKARRTRQAGAEEAESGLEEIERQLDEIDQQIDEMESLLVTTPSSSLEEIEAVVRLTAARFHDIMVTDPNDVFYDHGEARLVALIERVHEDLSGLIRHTQSDAS